MEKVKDGLHDQKRKWKEMSDGVGEEARDARIGLLIFRDRKVN